MISLLFSLFLVGWDWSLSVCFLAYLALTGWFINFTLLHGPPMLVDNTNFGLVVYNHANFYRFEETSSYWSVKRISVFSLLFIGHSVKHLRHHSV